MIFEQANKMVGIELYSNARFMGRKYVSYVRRKEIDYSPGNINSLLEIVPPEECDVKRRRRSAITGMMRGGKSFCCRFV
jgi:hypothetical protein